MRSHPRRRPRYISPAARGITSAQPYRYGYFVARTIQQVFGSSPPEAPHHQRCLNHSSKPSNVRPQPSSPTTPSWASTHTKARFPVRSGEVLHSLTEEMLSTQLWRRYRHSCTDTTDTTVPTQSTQLCRRVAIVVSIVSI